MAKECCRPARRATLKTPQDAGEEVSEWPPETGMPESKPLNRAQVHLSSSRGWQERMERSQTKSQTSRCNGLKNLRKEICDTSSRLTSVLDTNSETAL